MKHPSYTQTLNCHFAFPLSIYTGSYDGVMSKFDIATGAVQRCTGLLV